MHTEYKLQKKNADSLFEALKVSWMKLAAIKRVFQKQSAGLNSIGAQMAEL